jgi:hypothetical protein
VRRPPSRGSAGRTGCCRCPRAGRRRFAAQGAARAPGSSSEDHPTTSFGHPALWSSGPGVSGCPGVPKDIVAEGYVAELRFAYHHSTRGEPSETPKEACRTRLPLTPLSSAGIRMPASIPLVSREVVDKRGRAATPDSADYASPSLAWMVLSESESPHNNGASSIGCSG